MVSSRIRGALLSGGVLCALAFAQDAGATAINYLTDGTFTNGLTGWTVTTGAGGAGPAVITTNGSTPDQFGDVESADNLYSVSPDPDSAFVNHTNTKALYFTDDSATNTITQSATLAAGVYEFGFDVLATGSGAGQSNNATLTGTVNGTAIVSTSASQVLSQSSANTWVHYSENVDVLTSGTYAISLAFQGGGSFAKDLVLDDVYLINPSTLAGNGTAVPEPGSLSIMGMMVILFAFARRLAL
jgi:hypothetical protein